ncbi:MAG: alpha-2-macroglobulin family protein, partial [Pseudomonadota bacterium]
IAVSVSDVTMGTNQTALTVRGPLIVTPNLPLFAAPSDKFVATATIVNSLKGSGKDAKVKLAIEPSEQLQVIDAPKEELLIPEGKEITVPIKLQASDKLGSGELRLTASSGSEHFTISQTLSIRPPLPATTILKSGFTKELSDTVKDLPILYPELADIHAAVSSLPLAIIGGLRDYLVNYPYGCSEQLTSQTFPNVSLYGNSELIKAFGWNMQEMDTAIKHGFDRLRERQNSSGGFGMWSYYNDSNQFISNYVIHLFIEAKEKNLPVPEETLQNAIRNLKNTVNEAPHSIEEAREKAYGIYLLTRMGEITTNYIPHLTDYLDNYHRETWHSDLTAVYLASTYQLMQMEQESNALLDKFELDQPVIYTNSFYDYSFYDSLTKYSQYVYLISKNFPKRLAKMDKAVIYRVANFVGEENYNTVSSAYAVMAIAAYVDASKDALANVTMSGVDMAGKPVDLSVIGERLKVANIKQPLATLTFNSATPNFFYQIASNGYERKLPDKPIVQGLELSREYLDASEKPVTKAKIGDRIDVVMTLRSGNNKTLRNIAIVDLLPAGFELEPEAVKKEKVSKENNANSESEGEMPADTPSTGNPKEESEDENTTTSSSDKLADWTPESVDRREDRIIIYGTFGTEVKKYHYRIKATAKGEFITPPYYAESMYDTKLKTRGLAGKIEVE